MWDQFRIDKSLITIDSISYVDVVLQQLLKGEFRLNLFLNKINFISDQFDQRRWLATGTAIVADHCWWSSFPIHFVSVHPSVGRMNHNSCYASEYQTVSTDSTDQYYWHMKIIFMLTLSICMSLITSVVDCNDCSVRLMQIALQCRTACWARFRTSSTPHRLLSKWLLSVTVQYIIPAGCQSNNWHPWNSLNECSNIVS